MKIYCIENKIDGRKYIGKTIQLIEQRFKAHIRKSQSNERNHLHNAILKYGVDNFFVYEIDTAETETGLLEKEKYWIKELDTKNHGYNETDGGEGISGYKYSPEQIKEMSIRTSAYFANISPEERELISIQLRNRWNNYSEEEKIRRIALMRAKTPSNALGNRKKGWKLTDETKKKQGLAQKGKVVSQETIEKFKKSRIGKGTGINNSMANPIYKEKQKQACIGRKKIVRDDGSWHWGH